MAAFRLSSGSGLGKDLSLELTGSRSSHAAKDFAEMHPVGETGLIGCCSNVDFRVLQKVFGPLDPGVLDVGAEIDPDVLLEFSAQEIRVAPQMHRQILDDEWLVDVGAHEMHRLLDHIREGFWILVGKSLRPSAIDIGAEPCIFTKGLGQPHHCLQRLTMARYA